MAEVSKRQGLTGTGIFRVAAVFVLILLIFFAVEILPLHFSPRSLSLGELGSELRGRLPRILLIAAAVSLFITTRKPAQR